MLPACQSASSSSPSSEPVKGTTDHAAQKAAIAFICIYIFFFACSWGPIAWVVTGEIFPLKTRAKSLSMSTASNWLLNWAIAYATPYLVNVSSPSISDAFQSLTNICRTTPANPHKAST